MGQRGGAPARSVPKSVPNSVPASGDTVSGATWPKKAATYGCITPFGRLLDFNVIQFNVSGIIPRCHQVQYNGMQ